MFGIWKRRFPVLAYGLRCKLGTSLNVIIATAVLHNFARDMHEPLPPAPENVNLLNYLIDQGQIPNIPAVEARRNRGGAILNYREQLINNFFANL